MENATEIKTEVIIKKFKWDEVTSLSKVLAAVIFITMPFVGGWIGYVYAPAKIVEVEKIIVKEVPASRVGTEASVPGVFIFNCAESKSFSAVFTNQTVALDFQDGRTMTLPQTISASGARYATSDESTIFWNKGDTAFIEESGVATYTECTTIPQVM